MRCEFYACFIPQSFVSRNKKIHKMNSSREDLTLRRHLATDDIVCCHRSWATARSLGNWMRYCQEVILSSTLQDLTHLVSHFLYFCLSPLSFYICCLVSPESKSPWRSSAYYRLATTLFLFERTRTNIRHRSTAVITSTQISNLSALASWLVSPKILSISQH